MRASQSSREGRRGHVRSKPQVREPCMCLRLVGGGVTCRVGMEKDMDEALGCGVWRKIQPYHFLHVICPEGRVSAEEGVNDDSETGKQHPIALLMIGNERK